LLLVEGLIFEKFAEKYVVYSHYSQSISFILNLPAFHSHSNINPPFVDSQSISPIFKVFRVFRLFSKVFRLFSNYFVYSQSISFILNLPAFHSHSNINPPFNDSQSISPIFYISCTFKVIRVYFVYFWWYFIESHRISCIYFISESNSCISLIFVYSQIISCILKVLRLSSTCLLFILTPILTPRCWFLFLRKKNSQSRNIKCGVWKVGNLVTFWCAIKRLFWSRTLPTLSQNYSSRDITKKKPKAIRTITNVLTTLDAIFAIKTYVNEVVLV
jgi:hypothetical protein